MGASRRTPNREDGIVHSFLKEKVGKNLETRVQFPAPQCTRKHPVSDGVFSCTCEFIGNCRVLEKHKLLYVFQDPGFGGEISPVCHRQT